MLLIEETDLCQSQYPTHDEQFLKNLNFKINKLRIRSKI